MMLWENASPEAVAVAGKQAVVRGMANEDSAFRNSVLKASIRGRSGR